MRQGQNWLTIGKVVFGGLLIGAGSFLAFHASTNGSSTAKGYAVSIAHAQQGSGNSSAYTATWQANKLLAINTANLPIKFADNSSRQWLAIGPAEWQVTYKDGNGVTLATETWDIPQFITNQGQSCYVGGAATGACQPAGANAGTYLWGIANTSATGATNTAYKNMSFGIFNTSDSSHFYDNSSTNGRFQGQGATAQTNNNNNVEGFYSPGAYGWFAGALGADASGNDYTEAAGIMMPLQWNVTGTLFAN